jgi:transglutaminase-like putative cysteine protease
MSRELEFREGWTTVALLIIMLFCVAWSIQAAQWTDGLSILQAVVLLGGGLGILLAKSRIPNLTAHLLSLLAGFTWSAYLTSRAVATTMNIPLEAAVAELDREIWSWISLLFSQQTSAGRVMFLLLLSLLLWLLAYFSAWAVFRWQRVWWAVIVSGVALMINVNYAPRNLTGYLIAFVLFALLLVVRTSLAFYQHEWRVAQVGYSPELVYGFFRAGLIITIVAILLAWVAPVALASRPMQDVWDTLAQPWRKLQDQSARLFHDLNYQNRPAAVYFSPSMRFGGPVNLSDTPIMDIEATTGRYWRVMVFHQYTGDGWNNTDFSSILIDENEPRLVAPNFELRREVTQTVTLLQDLAPMGTIAAAGQPLRSALPLQARVSYVTLEGDSDQSLVEMDGETRTLKEDVPPVPSDASVLYSRQPLEADDSYQVVSSLTRSDMESLQGAGTEYPDWVVPRYLQLPESLPERIQSLAEEVTVGAETPYDKAVAIEDYLRDIPYNEQIAGPTEGQDGVDYFLFDVQEGYCDYYASAMVVMLRSTGVPARYVRGYGQGTKEDGVYHVLERDGHAWPEAFFPGYGWVEFEPTAGEPVLTRPRSLDAANSTQDDLERLGYQRNRDMLMDDMVDPGSFGPVPDQASTSLLDRVGPWLGAALVVLAVGLLVVALFAYRRRRRIEGMLVIEWVYEDLVNWVRRFLGITPLDHQTPYEYGASVGSMLPTGQHSVRRIVDSYVGYRFGGRGSNDDEVELAWQDTQRAIWRRWLAGRGRALLRLPRRLVPLAPPKAAWQEGEHTSGD